MQMALRAFYYVPVLGWLARDAAKGKPDARYYFLLNIVVLWAFLAYTIGYPFVIVTALTGAALMLTSIVVLTATDMIENSLRKLRAPTRRPS